MTGVVVGLDVAQRNHGLVALSVPDLEVVLALTLTLPPKLDNLELAQGTVRVIRTNLKGLELKHAAIEGYAARGAQLIRSVAVGTAVRLWLDRRVPWVEAAPIQVVKFAAGKRAKGATLKGVYRSWGFDTDDDNVADAYALARISAAVLLGGKAGPLAQHQREVLAALRIRR